MAASPAPLLHVPSPRWREPIAWLPHFLILNAAGATLVELLWPSRWVAPDAALLLGLGAVCRIQVPAPLGTGVDGIAAILTGWSPLIAAASAIMCLRGAAADWGQARSAGGPSLALLADFCRGPAVWAATCALYAACARQEGKSAEETRRLCHALFGESAVQSAHRERPRIPLAARLHPIAFPYSRFGVQRVDVPGGDTIDVWPVAEDGRAADRPIFFYVHGGAWRAGSSRVNPSSLLLHRLCQRGWKVFAVNYRKKRWPQHIDDCRAGLQFVRTQLGGNGPLVISGASAGGHLAALLASEAACPRLAAAVLMYPAVDPADDLRQYLPFPCRGGPTIRWFFEKVVLRGDPSLWPEATPLARVGGRFPPCLLVHGAADGLVPVATSRALLAALAGARTEKKDAFLEVPAAKHAFEHAGGPVTRAVHDGVVAWLSDLEGRLPGAF